VRVEAQVYQAVARTVETFGGIDILVNNASAIQQTATLDTAMKRFDLMHQINTRGTFLCSQACIPQLEKAENPHVLTLSPPLNLNPHWFAPHVAYTIAKYGMSLCVLGMAEEFRRNGIAFNALWPKTSIWTAAMAMLAGPDIERKCRTVDIVADAAYVMLSKPAREFTGQFCIDEALLRVEGISDFTRYRHPEASEEELRQDIFL
jgi:citronellol/citronellal dehydrogenase